MGELQQRTFTFLGTQAVTVVCRRLPEQVRYEPEGGELARQKGENWCSCLPAASWPRPPA